jgi:NAD(P)-dependent dehydrogenase (short-subunit alcohol dehydrogenase family)
MKKICLVVGGSKGLGKALVEAYRDAEFKIVEYSRSGEGEEHVTVDLSRRETSIDAIDLSFASVAKESWDEIVLIVNSATLYPIGPLHSSEPKQWWTHLDINLTMPISILGRFQAHMKDVQARKTAAFVSSGAAVSAMDGWSLYCASKAGVDHFVRCMALEQAALPFPITAVSLNPGIMDTDMQAGIRSATVEQFSEVAMFQSFKAEGSLVQPNVVAQNILNALSGDFENGTSIDVRG